MGVGAVGIAIGLVLEDPLFLSFSFLTSSQVLLVLFFAIGFVSFPPHMLTGLVARELSPTNMRSTAGCVVCFIFIFLLILNFTPTHSLKHTYTHTGKGCCTDRSCLCGLASSTPILRIWLEMYVIFHYFMWYSCNDRILTTHFGVRWRKKTSENCLRCLSIYIIYLVYNMRECIHIIMKRRSIKILKN